MLSLSCAHNVHRQPSAFALAAAATLRGEDENEEEEEEEGERAAPVEVSKEGRKANPLQCISQASSLISLPHL